MCACRTIKIGPKIAVLGPADMARLTLPSGLPDFSWSKHTKMVQIYQMTTNYTKRPINYSKWSKNLQNVPKLGFLV
jgi:hypothetical protein